MMTFCSLREPTWGNIERPTGGELVHVSTSTETDRQTFHWTIVIPRVCWSVFSGLIRTLLTVLCFFRKVVTSRLSHFVLSICPRDAARNVKETCNTQTAVTNREHDNKTHLLSCLSPQFVCYFLLSHDDQRKKNKETCSLIFALFSVWAIWLSFRSSL